MKENWGLEAFNAVVATLYEIPRVFRKLFSFFVSALLFCNSCTNYLGSDHPGLATYLQTQDSSASRISKRLHALATTSSFSSAFLSEFISFNGTHRSK